MTHPSRYICLIFRSPWQPNIVFLNQRNNSFRKGENKQEITCHNSRNFACRLMLHFLLLSTDSSEYIFFFSKNSFRNTIRVSYGLDTDQDQCSVSPDLGRNSLKRLSNSAVVACTVKPVLSGHSKGNPKLFSETDYHFMQVKSIKQVKSNAECSKKGAFWDTFDLH